MIHSPWLQINSDSMVLSNSAVSSNHSPRLIKLTVTFLGEWLLGVMHIIENIFECLIEENLCAGKSLDVDDYVLCVVLRDEFYGKSFAFWNRVGAADSMMSSLSLASEFGTIISHHFRWLVKLAAWSAVFRSLALLNKLDQTISPLTTIIKENKKIMI